MKFRGKKLTEEEFEAMKHVGVQVAVARLAGVAHNFDNVVTGEFDHLTGEEFTRAETLWNEFLEENRPPAPHAQGGPLAAGVTTGTKLSLETQRKLGISEEQINNRWNGRKK